MQSKPNRPTVIWLPDIVSQLLDRHDQRRTVRCEAWCHNTAGRDLRAPYERMAAAAERTADRSRGHETSTVSHCKTAQALSLTRSDREDRALAAGTAPTISKETLRHRLRPAGRCWPRAGKSSTVSSSSADG